MARANYSLDPRTSAALLLAALLALPTAARADDVSIELDSAGAFVVKNSGGSDVLLLCRSGSGEGPSRSPSSFWWNWSPHRLPLTRSTSRWSKEPQQTRVLGARNCRI